MSSSYSSSRNNNNFSWLRCVIIKSILYLLLITIFLNFVAPYENKSTPVDLQVNNFNVSNTSEATVYSSVDKTITFIENVLLKDYSFKSNFSHHHNELLLAWIYMIVQDSEL